MKTTLTILAALMLCSFTFVQDQSKSSKVYVCMGSQSKRYHKTPQCMGLSKCSKEVKEITLEEAKKMGRTPCGYCYK